MANPIKVAGKVTMQDKSVAEFLTWLLKEIEEELKSVLGENTRLIKIKYEAKRLLKTYDIVR